MPVQRTKKIVQAKNLNFTSEKRCKCGSWKNHWESHTEGYFNVCAVVGCDELATVGAHVNFGGETGSIEARDYIIPLCHTHNSQSSNVALLIKQGTRVVWANVAQTCGKPAV